MDLAILLCSSFYQFELRQSIRNKWVADLFLERETEGFYSKLYPLLIRSEKEKDFRYNLVSFIRMNSEIENLSRIHLDKTV